MEIVWLKTGPLHPLDTGGKIRTYNMLRVLGQRQEVAYLSLCMKSCERRVLAMAGEYSSRQVWIPWRETRKGSMAFCAALAANLFSSLPYVIQKYRSHRMADAVCALEETQRPDLIVCDFLTPAVNLFSHERRPKAPTLLFQHNIESLIWRRLFENAHGVKRAYLRGQWQRMERFERNTCARFDGVVGVSEEDCETMRKQFGATNVLGAVPTGVDCEFFQADDRPRKAGSLVFLGSMDWMPNVDAVQFFVEETWPVLKRQFPQATFAIVGRNPSSRVKELERHVPAVRVTGTVNDVRPFLAEAAAMIVPLRVGGGTRIKIFEGMAMGIPVVSTRIGAEGLPVSDGENILLADTPQDFAGQIAALFEQPALARRIGANGRALVQERFSWESVTRTFESYCIAVCENRKERT